MTTALTIALIAAIAAAVLYAASLLLDRWLDRRLMSAWDAESDTPLYEATVKALRYRPGVQ